MLLLPVPASVRRRRRRAPRRTAPRSRARAHPGGSPPCRGLAPVRRRARRPGLPGWDRRRGRPLPVPACPSGSPACGRDPAWRRGAPGRGLRGGSGPSSAFPAALDLRGPPVYLRLREDALLDEEPLRSRGPALVVGEVAVVREALDGAAVLVRGLDALLAQSRVDGVGDALPVLGIADVRVHGARRPAAHVVGAGHPSGP